MTEFLTLIDSIHPSMNQFSSPIARDVWEQKYKAPNDRNFFDTADRVVNAVFAKDLNSRAATDTLSAIQAGLFIPAGRIMSGTGTGKRVTLLNCFTNGRIEDNMESIMQHNAFAALSMQQGGGIGTNFSPIRPKGAILKRTGSIASGPLPFMDMWNAMGITIESAGSRRGAQMGTLCDTHPDLPLFIKAKQEKGRLTNFNLSILVSEAFMEAIDLDEDWLLYFHEPPHTRDPECVSYDFVDEDGRMQYVYSVWRARDLWELITRSTYEYSEPGIIFIDRINELNNLYYCETIDCTNPCGEQPFAPHGACCLSSVNLARMVHNPFTKQSWFDYELLRKVAYLGVRFLDNVLDVTGYPLEQQHLEAQNKRRIGLGFTGLADALAQLGIRYGSLRSAEFAESFAACLAQSVYSASSDLAAERGSFPLFDKDKFLEGKFVKRLPQEIREKIARQGIRNGVLLTVAPNGTNSLILGNVSSGIEPTFSHLTKRKVRQPDDTFQEYIELSYTAQLWQKLNTSDLPAYAVTATDLSIDEHLLIQGKVQQWIDASISKTINVPTDTTYEEFVKVYQSAYLAGCKGCTTYRPNAVRGSILVDASATTNVNIKTPDDTTAAVTDVTLSLTLTQPTLRPRPDVLVGTTYKIKWPRRDSAIYLTINDDEGGHPYEVFISSKDMTNIEWTTAVTLMITAIFRNGGDISFIHQELQQIQSLNDGAWLKQKYFSSLPAYIGYLLEQHLANKDKGKNGEGQEQGQEQGQVIDETLVEGAAQPKAAEIMGEICPKCKAPAVIRSEGCRKCLSCGHSECG